MRKNFFVAKIFFKFPNFFEKIPFFRKKFYFGNFWGKKKFFSQISTFWKIFCHDDHFFWENFKIFEI